MQENRSRITLGSDRGKKNEQVVPDVPPFVCHLGCFTSAARFDITHEWIHRIRDRYAQVVLFVTRSECHLYGEVGAGFNISSDSGINDHARIDLRSCLRNGRLVLESEGPRSLVGHVAFYDKTCFRFSLQPLEDCSEKRLPVFRPPRTNRNP